MHENEIHSQMKKTRPPLLKKGDKIGIVSPARFVEPHEIAPAIEWLKEKGYVPVLGKHIYKREALFLTLPTFFHSRPPTTGHLLSLSSLGL